MSGARGAGTPGAGVRRLRFALVGCGDFGKHLAGYAVEQAELAALCDPDAGSLAATAAALDVEAPAMATITRCWGASASTRCW